MPNKVDVQKYPSAQELGEARAASRGTLQAQAVSIRKQTPSSSLKSKIFFTLLGLAIPLMFRLLYQTHLFYKNLTPPSDRRVPRYSDLLVGLLIGIGQAILRYYLTNGVLYELGCKLVSRKQWPDPKIFESRVQRFATCSFKFLYFAILVPVSFLYIRNLYWIPYQLGGKGDIALSFADLPFPELPSFAFNFYQISIGWAIHSLVYQVGEGMDRTDLAEMTLHHVVTIFLLIFSYLNGNLRFGIAIQWCHDISDVFGYATKMFADTTLAWVANFLVFPLLGSWAWCRLYTFPAILLYSVYYDLIFPIPSITVFWYFLCTLLLLHYYWFFLMLQITWIKVTKGFFIDTTDIEVAFEKGGSLSSDTSDTAKSKQKKSS